jgi:2-C-methyl-D-erythritol 4-phosphate cytidylyltransferase
VRTALIIPAAGRGERLGASVPKALVRLGDKSLLEHALTNALAARVVDSAVVAAPADQVDQIRRLLSSVPDDVTVVVGGATRRESVSAALSAVPDDVDAVLVHDAARCLTPPSVFAAVVDAIAAGAGAVVPVVPVADTIKEVHDDLVTATPDRSALRAVQTPQGFTREVLRRAHTEATGDATDDAGMVEQLGIPVRTVAGSPHAFKITGPLDLTLAEAVLAAAVRGTS